MNFSTSSMSITGNDNFKTAVHSSNVRGVIWKTACMPIHKRHIVKSINQHCCYTAHYYESRPVARWGKWTRATDGFHCNMCVWHAIIIKRQLTYVYLLTERAARIRAGSRDNARPAARGRCLTITARRRQEQTNASTRTCPTAVRATQGDRLMRRQDATRDRTFASRTRHLPATKNYHRWCPAVSG